MLIDTLAGEYGWTVEEAMAVPVDQAELLLHAILCRRGVVTYRRKIAVEEAATGLNDRLQGIFGQVDKTA